jgi:drug/metabolite transporter (DMT)-like permease
MANLSKSVTSVPPARAGSFPGAQDPEGVPTIAERIDGSARNRRLRRAAGFREDAGVLALGLASALAASALFNVGIVLQALDARAAPRELGLRLALLRRLLARPRWLLGWLLGVAGIWPQIVAYANAPFVVVQPALALGLLIVLALAERMLHERVGPKEVIGTVAIIGGVALVAWGSPSHTETHRGWVPVVAVAGVLSIGGLAPFLVRGTRLDTAMLTIVAAGCGFGATNVATKLLGDDVDVSHYGNAAVWAVVGLAMGVAATVTNMTAFQRRAATTVVPVSTAVQTFLPIVFEPIFLRERWGSAAFDGAPIAAGLAAALVGSVLIAGNRGVSDLIAGAA